MACSAGYTSRSPSNTPPTSVSEIDGYAMCKPLPSNPRKRSYSEQRPTHESPQTPSKRHKLKYNHPKGSQPPPAFWDNLSKIWLTRCALQESDWRHTQPTLSTYQSLYRRSHRPVTRSVLAKLDDKERTWEPSQSATDFLARCSVGCLRDIKLGARHGGLDLSDLRGYQRPVNPLCCTMTSRSPHSRRRKRGSTFSSKTKDSSNTTTTRNTRPYDRDFQQNLIDGRVYPDGYEYPDGTVPASPNNWEEMNLIFTQPRPSLSPSQFSDDKFRRYKRAEAHASKEDQVTKTVIPFIEGEIPDARCVSGKIPFTNLDHLTDGTLVPGNPDLYFGARPEQLNQQVRNELSGQIIPSTQHDLPIAPNFFLEAKGPDGSAAVAGRQACYNGALGARGMHSLQSYGQDEPVYDNSAYTITSIYHNGQLKMYTTHLTHADSPGSRPEYHMTQFGAFAMTHDRETFRKGATVFRNTRDWSKEKRDEAIRVANEKVDHTHSTTSATGSALASSFTTLASTVAVTASPDIAAEPQSQEYSAIQTAVFCTSEEARQESETSTDELAMDINPPAKRPSRSHRNFHRERSTRQRSKNKENVVAQY